MLLATGTAMAQPGGAAATQQRTLDKAAERGNAVFDRAAALQNKATVHGWLMSERVSEGVAAPIQVGVSDDERRAIDDPSSIEVPVRVGVTKSLSKRIAFSDLRPSNLSRSALARSDGAMAGTDDGGYVFSMALTSPDATAIRVHFTDFWLSQGAELYLFTEDGQVFGPYGGAGPHADGEFWSHTLMGDQIFLQLRQLGPVTAADLRDTSFVIGALGHIRPKFLGSACTYNASCIESAACDTASSAVDAAKMAVAHMQWISGPFLYMCTGGLLADTDTSSDIPYFLTANHCIRRGKEARSLESFFQLTGTCNNDGPITCDDVFDHRANHPQELRTLGATITATSSNSDYTLLKLKEPAPEGSLFLGWDANAVADAHGDVLFRISHPSGAPQAYSSHEVDTFRPTCGTWPRGAWIYSSDTHGATEGGSSGSPVVNGEGRVVGQLSGSCGYNVGEVCDSFNNATVDGAFANYFSEIERFLVSGSSCSSTEVEEVSCNDGADNDCDGFVDSADSDCNSGSSGGGAGSGESCMQDADCESGSCSRGKPSTRVCQ